MDFTDRKAVQILLLFVTMERPAPIGYLPFWQPSTFISIHINVILSF